MAQELYICFFFLIYWQVDWLVVQYKNHISQKNFTSQDIDRYCYCYLTKLSHYKTTIVYRFMYVLVHIYFLVYFSVFKIIIALPHRPAISTFLNASVGGFNVSWAYHNMYKCTRLILRQLYCLAPHSWHNTE